MPDLRRPPASSGYADLGNGILVPQAVADAEWLKAAEDWAGLDELQMIAARKEAESDAHLQSNYGLEVPQLSGHAEAEARIREAQQQLTALKAAQPIDDPTLLRYLREASGDWRLEFDSPMNRSFEYEQMGILGAFNLLREWNIAERMMVLTRTHMAHERNPLANTAVGLTTRFVVGKGLNITYANPDVQAVIEDFINDPENDFEAMQTQACDALQIDGEVFIRFFPEAETGRLLIAPLMPWNIKWIITDPVVKNRVINYHHQGNYWNGFDENTFVNEDLPPDQVLHARINKLPYEVRGRPELFRILPWLKAYKDWLEERARVNRRQGSIYWDMTLKNSTPAQVNATRAAYKQPPPPGSFFVHNDNVTIQALAGNVRAADAAEDGRALKLMALAGLQLPEYMFGEGAHSTKATASTQELPALAKFSYFQDVLVTSIWKPVLTRLVMLAIGAGVLPEWVGEMDIDGNPKVDAMGQPKMIRATKAFTASYGDVSTPDPLNLAQALQIAVASGWISSQSAATRMGYDYADEEEKIEAEKAKSMAQAYSAGAGMTGTPIAPQPLTGPPVASDMPPKLAAPTKPSASVGPAQAAETESEDDVKSADVMKLVTQAMLEGIRMGREAQPAALPAPGGPSIHLDNARIDLATGFEERMAEAFSRLPAPIVNVAAAAVNVPAPIVNFEYNEAEQPADIVNVAAPVVHVAGPAPAQVQVVENAPRETVFTLIKDRDGNTTGIRKTEQ